MIAPTTLAVAASLSAEKTYGSELGTRSFQSTIQRLAAYVRIRSSARASAERRPRSVLIVTGKNVRYAAITATAPQPCSGPGNFGLTQTTTIGAIARIGIVWLATMYGSRPRCSSRECTSTIPSAKPTTAPSPKPTTASLAVKSDLCNSTVISAGWLTCTGCPNALKIVHRCGIEVESTTNGQLHPVDDQIHRYSSQRPASARTTATTAVTRPAIRAACRELSARRAGVTATA